MPERGTGPTHARHIAGGLTTSIANQSMPDQPPGMILVPPDYQSGQTDLKLADAINYNAKTTTADGHAARDVEAPEHGNKKPETTEPPAREGKPPGLAPDKIDSGHGPSLWAEELDTPKRRLVYDEVPDKIPSGRGETAACYTSIKRYGQTQSGVSRYGT